jgi:hypothetical protein
VTDLQIVCPNCRTEIKLTESLAAPFVAETRKQFEALAAKEADFGRREARLKQAQDELVKASEAIDEKVAAKLKSERDAIAVAEAKGAPGVGRRSQRARPATCRSAAGSRYKE